MKIKYLISSGHILAASEGDSTILDYDSGTENTAIVSLDSDVLFHSFKYMYSGEVVILIPKFSLDISCSATDTDGDGYVDIASDGVDTCTITIQKEDANGDDETSATDEIWVSTSAGKLDFIHGNLVNGQKTVTLTSSIDTTLTKIKITTKNPLITDGQVEVQFRP